MSDVPRGMPLAALARLSARRPWLVLVVTVFLVAAASLSLTRLRISASLEAMFGLHSPAAMAMHRVTTEFQTGEALLVIAEPAGSGPLDDATRGALIAFAERLVASLRTDGRTRDLLAWARYTRDPAFEGYFREVILPQSAYYLGPEATADLVERFDPERLAEQFARNESLIAAPGPSGHALSKSVLRDPLRLVELLSAPDGAGFDAPPFEAPGAPGAPPSPEFSTDGRAILIRIAAKAPLNDLAGASFLTRAVSDLIDELRPAELRTSIGGPFAISATSSRIIRADAVVSTLVSVGLLYGLFVLFYRRPVAPLLIGVVAAAGMILGFGAVALFSSRVSPLAAGVAALLAGLGVDYAIHFVAHFDSMRSRGVSPLDAAVGTAREMALPITTNCLTTIFGFASLWPSSIQMLTDFARLGAAGLIGCLLSTFTLLPALLVLIEGRTATRPTPPSRFGFVADRVAGAPRRWSLCSIGILLVALAGAGVQGFVPRLEGDLTVLHPRPNAALRATDDVLSRFAGQGELIPVLVRAPSPEALVSTAHEIARALSSPACTRVGVVEVLGLHRLLPDPAGARAVSALLAQIRPGQLLGQFDAALAASAFDPAAYRGYRDFLAKLLAPGSPADTGTLLRHYSIASRLFPAGASVHAPPRETVLMVRLAEPLRAREQRARVVGVMNGALAPFPGASLAGLAAVSEALEDSTRRDIPRSILISAVLVLIWLSIVFRRPIDVLFALTPLLFAGALTVALMVAAGSRFNPINSIAIPLLDGIAVDAGVFLVAAARRAGKGRSALLHELRPTVHAVLLATATTVTGFASLCVMHTPAIRSLGLVAGLGVFASACGALFLLVPLLLARAGRR